MEGPESIIFYLFGECRICMVLHMPINVCTQVLINFSMVNRSTRESTPCSLIRNSDTVGTPGSTTRRSSSIADNQRVGNETQRTIPTALDMDEFFAQAERQQQKLFVEKYNFDIINDMPLPGRYEWEQVIP